MREAIRVLIGGLLAGYLSLGGEMISDYIDNAGLLDKKTNADGGDTCQREGMYWTLAAMLNVNPMYPKYARDQNFHDVTKKLHPVDGVLLRHSNPSWDASDWDRMSRDQLQPMIIAMGYWSKHELQRLRRGHRRRGYFFTNNTRKNGANKLNHGTEVAGEKRDYSWKTPDITGPEIWGNFIRAQRAWWFYPLLMVYDLELFVGAILWRHYKNHNIALNHTLSQMQAIDIMPTPLSWLASKIMRVDKLLEICADHLDDPYVEMPIFTYMFREAWEAIK